MAVLYRCDICGKETKVFWNLKYERKIVDTSGRTPHVELSKVEAVDVCSEKCEARAVIKINARVATIAYEDDVVVTDD